MLIMIHSQVHGFVKHFVQLLAKSDKAQKKRQRSKYESLFVIGADARIESAIPIARSVFKRYKTKITFKVFATEMKLRGVVGALADLLFRIFTWPFVDSVTQSTSTLYNLMENPVQKKD